jgi:hypothetical protein
VEAFRDSSIADTNWSALMLENRVMTLSSAEIQLTLELSQHSEGLLYTI